MYVIERMIEGRKHFYAGYISEYSPKAFAESGVQWNKSLGRYSKFDEFVADQIVKQLAGMGIVDVEKKMILEKRKKAGK